MVLLLNVVGWVSAIFGLMFLFIPKYLAKISTAVNKILLELDSILYKMHIGIGISLCLVSFMAFFMVYYLGHK